MTNHHPIAIAAAALAIFAPIAAPAAQTSPAPPPARGPAQPPQPPPGARPPGGPPAPTSGVITSSRPYHVVLTGPAGRTIALTLRQGTIIDPRGTTLVPGMRVTYAGRPHGDGTILADRIALGGISGGPPGPRGPRPGGPPPPLATGPRPAPPAGAPPPTR